MNQSVLFADSCVTEAGQVIGGIPVHGKVRNVRVKTLSLVVFNR